MIAPKHCCFGKQRKKPTLSAFAVWDGRKADITDKIKKEVGTNLLNELLYLLTHKYTDLVIKGAENVKRVISCCVPCKKIEGKSLTQAPTKGLPEFRVGPALMF